MTKIQQTCFQTEQNTTTTIPKNLFCHFTTSSSSDLLQVVASLVVVVVVGLQQTLKPQTNVSDRGTNRHGERRVSNYTTRSRSCCVFTATRYAYTPTQKHNTTQHRLVATNGHNWFGTIWPIRAIRIQELVVVVVVVVVVVLVVVGSSRVCGCVWCMCMLLWL